jgi:hypothetical protein
LKNNQAEAITGAAQTIVVDDRYVRIPLHVTEIDDLIAMGHLQQEQRQDDEALKRLSWGSSATLSMKCAILRCAPLAADAIGSRYA